jgi:tetratricopeptide (TPR) repeat protein
MGMEALAARNPAEAESLAIKVLKSRLKHPEALHLLGLSLLAQGRAEAAISPLEAAVRLRATPAAETDFAAALQLTGRLDEAKAMLTRAIAHDPPYLPAFHDLGVLHYSVGELAEAEAVLQRGLDAEPASPELLAAMGNILLETSQIAEAKVVLARAIANVPGHPAAVFGMGNALMAEGDFARAADRFRHVLNHDPSHGGALLSLGTCLLELGETDAGTAKLREAVQSRPQLRDQALAELTRPHGGRASLTQDQAEELLAAR